MRETTGEFWNVSPVAGDPWAEQFQGMLSATHLPWNVMVSPDRGGKHESWARRVWLDDLSLVDCECGPSMGVRGRQELSETEGEFVVLLINRFGQESVSQGAAQVQLETGDAVVWDSTKPAAFNVAGRYSKRSLLFPRSALEEMGDHSLEITGTKLPVQAPAVQLFTNYLEILNQTVPFMSAPAVSAARNATLELFAGALRTDPSPSSSEAARPALRAVISRYIDRRLLDHDLTPSNIAVAHHISVRTLHRIFSVTDETVSEIIRSRRLDRARAELASSDKPVSTIALRWQFSDVSHFSRSFKAYYGATPSAYRKERSAPLQV